jgi:hypothetical protein
MVLGDFFIAFHRVRRYIPEPLRRDEKEEAGTTPQQGRPEPDTGRNR